MKIKMFSDLPPETQAAIRAKQAAKKRARKARRDQAREKAAQRVPKSSGAAGTPCASSIAAASPGFPELITSEDYFRASPGGLFRHPQIKATQSGVDLLLANLSNDAISSCNYFLFTGTDDECWDPVLNARLAWEGFFVITADIEGSPVPLPELQPYYGVLLWPNFERSKCVRKELAKLRNDHYPQYSTLPASRQRKGKSISSSAACKTAQIHQRYKLINCADPTRTWKLLDMYHDHNWLTKRYFDTMVAASSDETVNFVMHCIELYEEDADVGSTLPLAGEIGFSIGRVYTSLSGWTQVRSAKNYGTVQLCLLGRWLQKLRYAFWSLGHCYCPVSDNLIAKNVMSSQFNSLKVFLKL